jgi:hypothetical protein
MKGDAKERTHRCKGRRPPRRLLPCSLLEVKRVQRDGERCETTPVEFKLTQPAELVRIFRSNQFELLVAKQSRALKPFKHTAGSAGLFVCGGQWRADAEVPSTRLAAMRRFGTVLYERFCPCSSSTSRLAAQRQRVVRFLLRRNRKYAI